MQIALRVLLEIPQEVILGNSPRIKPEVLLGIFLGIPPGIKPPEILPEIPLEIYLKIRAKIPRTNIPRRSSGKLSKVFFQQFLLE